MRRRKHYCHFKDVIIKPILFILLLHYDTDYGDAVLVAM